MKRMWISGLIGAFAVVAATASIAQQTSRQIDARTVPVPAGASRELQDSLTAMPMLNAGAGAENLKTDEDWERFVSARDGGAGQTVDAAAKQLGVSVDPFVVEGVSIYRVMPNDVDPRHEDHRFLYLHGGGYVFGGGAASVSEAMMIASRAKMQVLSIDYRMPPKHPFPAALDDVVTIYRHVLGNRPASSIAMGGTSAGAGLTLAAVHRLIELGVETPGALFAGTPWADLTKTSDTLFTNESVDRVLVQYEGLLEGAAKLYADGRDLTDQFLSPVYGSFERFPPTYLVTGTRDMLLSDTVRVHRKLRSAGVIADLNVYEGMSHAGYMIAANTPESQQVYSELNDFLLRHLD